MRSHVRTFAVLAVALILLALFLYNVNLWGVLSAIARSRPEWLALALASTFANLAIRALRWKFLLEPLGPTSFASAFRATTVGFAASAVLPARAGEVIRPYFLARQAPLEQQGRMTATGAFATIILERLLDIVTVLLMLASFVFVFGRDLANGRNRQKRFFAEWLGGPPRYSESAWGGLHQHHEDLPITRGVTVGADDLAAHDAPSRFWAAAGPASRNSLAGFQ